MKLKEYSTLFALSVFLPSFPSSSPPSCPWQGENFFKAKQKQNLVQAEASSSRCSGRAWLRASNDGQQDLQETPCRVHWEKPEECAADMPKVHVTGQLLRPGTGNGVGTPGHRGQTHGGGGGGAHRSLWCFPGGIPLIAYLFPTAHCPCMICAEETQEGRGKVASQGSSDLDLSRSSTSVRGVHSAVAQYVHRTWAARNLRWSLSSGFHNS